MNVLPVVIIATLTAAVVWMGAAVVRLENYRYANSVGFCTQFDAKAPQQRIDRDTCLDRTETRMHWVWHLLYGLKVL